MLRRCTWHKKYFGFVKYLGTKEPGTEGITDTLCPQCLAIEMLAIDVGQMERETKRMRVAKEVFRLGAQSREFYKEVLDGQV